MEAERASIRASLTFTFRPLEGKGQGKNFGLQDWASSSFRPIVEELLVAYWEISAKLDQKTVRGDIIRLRSFLQFLDERIATGQTAPAATTMQDLSFQLLREYEHWLSERPSKYQDLLATRIESLKAFFAENRLPCRLKTKNGEIVNIAEIAKRVQISPRILRTDPVLIQIVVEEAQRQGLRMPTLRRPPNAPSSSLPSKRKEPPRKLTTKAVEELYYTLSKTLRHIDRYRRHLLADDFVIPPLSDPSTSRGRRIKSKSLTPVEFESLKKACRQSVRSTKRRILREGPSRVVRGRPDVAPGESQSVWAKELDNLLAYLATYATCQVISQNPRSSQHARFCSGLRQRSGETAHSVARWLYPDHQDLCGFLLLMGCCEHAPLNLSSLLTLHVEPDAPKRHCVRPSPTPHHKRIFFGKPRAGIDQAFIDVPARSSLDLPGLIESVIELTRGVRACCSPDLRHTLWLYMSERHGIKVLKDGPIASQLREFVARKEIFGDDGQLLRGFNYRRLRPTVTRSVALDHGLETAQARASQADPRQTYAYVNNPASDQRLEETIGRAQSKAIASVKAGFSQRPPQADIDYLVRELAIPPGAAIEILTGKRDKLFSSCIDDCNGQGPEIAGRPCGRYEACLVCVNSVILERHLPRLITYYQHWLRMADEMDEEAWEDVHALNCAIVERHLTLFDPDLVAQVTSDVLAQPPVTAYRRFKQS